MLSIDYQHYQIQKITVINNWPFSLLNKTHRNSHQSTNLTALSHNSSLPTIGCDTDVYFPALLSTLVRRRFQVKPATLLTHFDILCSFGGGVLRYPVPKWLPFLI